jgi:hypothetical protein
MGLDFNNNDAHWSYGGFNSFRRKVASSIGINLDEMYGFQGSNPWETVNDDVKIFLDHSDCDGVLTPEECAKVWPRLQEIIGKWDKGDFSNQYDIFQSELLIAGMKNSVESNENLEFC